VRNLASVLMLGCAAGFGLWDLGRTAAATQTCAAGLGAACNAPWRLAYLQPGRKRGWGVDTAGATVFIIDDDAEVRGGLGRLLRSDGWSVVEFGAAQDFLDRLPVRGVGCILLDVMMPGMSGPELHERLARLGLQMPVVYLTGQGSVPVSVRAMKLGAVDFLEKPIDADRLLSTIALAIARSREENERHHRHAGLRQRVDSLSAREREVMNHVIAGRLNKQIAADLGIAEKTVKVHRGRVMAKVGVRRVAELVHLCDELGIVQAGHGSTA